MKKACAPTTAVLPPWDANSMSWTWNVVGSRLKQFSAGSSPGTGEGHTRTPCLANWLWAWATRYFWMALVTLETDAFSTLLGVCQGASGYFAEMGKRGDVMSPVPAA